MPAAATAPAAPTPLVPAINLPAIPPLPVKEPASAVTQETAHPAAIESSAAVGGDSLPAILFEKDGARLPDAARPSLITLAGRLTADASLDIQLLAYAGGDEDHASKARRLSLSRALAVRSFLIDQGVRSTRIEVRAMGNKVPEGPADRVDVVVLKR